MTQSELTYYKFIRQAHLVEARIKQALKAFDITHPQLNVLYLLNEQYPKVINVKTLKNKMIVNQPDITRLIDRLVKKELVVRETCPENRRMVNLTLTKKGRTVFDQAQTAGKKVTGNFFSDFLSDAETSEMYRLLNKITFTVK